MAANFVQFLEPFIAVGEGNNVGVWGQRA